MKKIDWRTIWYIPFAIIMLAASVFCSEIKHENAEVVEVSQSCVEIRTEDGNEFAFYSSRPYSIGETHEVFFNTRGTVDRTDDEIIIVR